MSSTEISAVEKKLIFRAAWRILPFMMICYLVSYIDRVNIGFATFQMDKAIHITASIFGVGGGLYFVSYVVCEVPSNVLITRFGVRLFLTRIMITWGLITCFMALVQGTWSFLSLRFLLGAAEAGLFPGVILYLTYWFPRAYRSSFIGWFAVAIPLSGMIGSPISAALLQMDKIWGFAGWQWLFVLEGLPAVALGIICYLFIADGPGDARWMTPEERDIYKAMLARDEPVPAAAHGPSIWRILVNPTVLGLAVVLSASSAISNTYAVWVPKFIKSFGFADLTVGWLNAAPYLAGAVIMMLGAYSSDRFRERVWHTALPLFVTAASIVLMMVSGDFGWGYLMLWGSIFGIYASKAPIWAVATEWLPAEMKAVGIAQVNAVSSLISFFPIFVIGFIRDAGGSFALAFLPMAAISAAGAIIIVTMSMNRRRGASAAAADSVLTAQSTR